MNLGLYDVLVHWAERTGNTMDDAVMFCGLVWFVTLVVFAWAFGFAVDMGFNIYETVRELFRAILRRIRRKKDEGP